MPPNVDALTAAIAAVHDATSGRQRQVRVNRLLRLAVELNAEKQEIERRLERMWNSLEAMCRKSENGPEHGRRESVFFSTLAAYEAACDALHEAKAVLCP
jgi:glycerol-3-phosphate O-acyltransferase